MKTNLITRTLTIIAAVFGLVATPALAQDTGSYDTQPTTTQETPPQTTNPEVCFGNLCDGGSLRIIGAANSAAAGYYAGFFGSVDGDGNSTDGVVGETFLFQDTGSDSRIEIAYDNTGNPDNNYVRGLSTAFDRGAVWTHAYNDQANNLTFSMGTSGAGSIADLQFAACVSNTCGASGGESSGAPSE